MIRKSYFLLSLLQVRSHHGDNTAALRKSSSSALALPAHSHHDSNHDKVAKELKDRKKANQEMYKAVLSQEWKGSSPGNVTAQEGLCALIPCHYSYPPRLANRPRGAVWFNTEEKIPDAPLAFHSKNHNYESPRLRYRTRLSGDLNGGDCSLIIDNITRQDAGPYFFRIEFDNGPSHNYYPATRLHVSDFTDKPMIFLAEIIAGKCVNVSCTFNTTCNGTAPVLTWVNHTDIPGSVSNSVTQRDVTLTYTSVLTLIPSLKHHGQTLTCRVRYPSVSSERTLKLTVQYAPRNLSITSLDTIKDSSINIKEGISIVIFCSVESFPASNLTWRHVGVTMNRTSSNNELWLEFLHVTSRVAGDYQCMAENEHGAMERTISITVECRDSNEWKVGLLVAGIILSVELAGFLIFKCVRKIKAATEERASETSDIAMTSSPLPEKHQGTQSAVVVDTLNTTSDATSEAKTPAPQDLSEGAAGGDAGHGQPAKHEDLLYANINFLKLPSGDGTVHSGEDTEYAEIKFQ